MTTINLITLVSFLLANTVFCLLQPDTTFQPQDRKGRQTVNTVAPFPIHIPDRFLMTILNKL